MVEGCPPLGLQSVLEQLHPDRAELSYPDKLSDYSVGMELDEEGQYTAHYGLPEVDYVVGTMGIIYGYYGSFGLWPVMILLGWAYARIDDWLDGASSTWAFLMGFGFAETCVMYEQAVVGYFLTFRCIIAFYCLCQGMVWLQRLSSQKKRSQGGKCPPLCSFAPKPAFRPE